ncbi:soluble lamin-associated protein of 75 kDa [Salarias fasciatus]|uniref:Family with sequence similarity 169 member Aa n=1 Tax=Salarias fasciatus TaxID=181472 RepID=A0A672HTB6_SALFA|nr:soluble lamin-associated protein of 75 kDa [Salarias fasciatus]
MKFPVDLLADVSQVDLERSAHNYMNSLVYSNPDSPEQLTISGSTKVTIDIASVGYTPLYGSSDKHKMLALFSPSDPLTTVALYLSDRWWPVEDILKSSDPARDGVIEVQTPGERTVLYILNRIIYRTKEMSSDELPFLCHGENDYAKILWKNGEAVGFYSVKPSGTCCNSYSTRSYELPVMDSIFVRKSQRGKGFGLQMLDDFVHSFEDDCLGLRYPLTKSMYKVCEKYLRQNPEDADLLWEVEGTGGFKQRSNIANKIQAMNLSAVSRNLSFTEESHLTVEVTENDVVMEAITTQIEESQAMQCTVETIEEVTVLTISKEADDVPVVTRGRSSGSKQRKTEEKVTEDKSEKLIRIEDIEAETPREVSMEQKTELHLSQMEQTKVISNVVDEKESGEEDHVTLSEITGTAVDSQDPEEADDTSASTTEEAQGQDDACPPNGSPLDGAIKVENVASETQEAGEECGKDEDVNLDTEGKEAQTAVADSNSEETDTQQDSEDVEPHRQIPW